MKTPSAKVSRKKIGENVRKARKAQGISQLQLGYEAGITREIVSQIEGGKSNVTHDTLHAIATALEISIVDLFDFD